MKKVFLLIFFAAFLISCSGDDNNLVNNSLIGTWNWIESSGGIDGRTETPESTGNVIKLEISSSSVKRFVNDSLQSEHGYSIETRNSLIFKEEREMIIYQDQTNQTFLLTGNRLMLHDECYDCFQSEYVRE